MMNNYEFTMLYEEMSHLESFDFHSDHFKSYKLVFFVKEFIEREKKHDMSKTYKVMLDRKNDYPFKRRFVKVYKWLKDGNCSFYKGSEGAEIARDYPFLLNEWQLDKIIRLRVYSKRIWEAYGFDEAMKHGFKDYVCHHLLETKCPVYHPYASDLKKWNLYYNRENPKEFIFLTRSDHRKLHAEFPQTKFKKLKDMDLWELFPVEEDDLDFYELD